MEKNVEKIRQYTIEMGEQAKKTYETKKDLGAAKVAINAFALSIKSALVQVQYKKLTGNPKKIDFLEE